MIVCNHCSGLLVNKFSRLWLIATSVRRKLLAFLFTDDKEGKPLGANHTLFPPQREKEVNQNSPVNTTASTHPEKLHPNFHQGLPWEESWPSCQPGDRAAAHEAYRCESDLPVFWRKISFILLRSLYHVMCLHNADNPGGCDVPVRRHRHNAFLCWQELRNEGPPLRRVSFISKCYTLWLRCVCH